MTGDRRRQTVYVATGNAGKLRDFDAAARTFCSEPGEYAFRLEPLPGLAGIPAPDENASSFEGNACAKALYYSGYLSGQIVIADDSGLEVDALGGAPGVYSARYARRDGSPQRLGELIDAANNRRLLDELARVLMPRGTGAPLDDCTARYRCVLAAARDGKVIATAEGVVEGCILPAPRGTGGFGYDPLFFLPEYGQTMAETDPATRLAISHRGHALRALLPKLACLP